MLEHHRSISGAASAVGRAAAAGVPEDRKPAGGRLKLISHRVNRQQELLTFIREGI